MFFQPHARSMPRGGVSCFFAALCKSLPGLMAALLCSGAYGQQVWTLNESLRSALHSHPSVLGSQSASAAAVAEREGAEWQRYPSASVEANAANSGGSSTVLRVDQPLWSGGRITAGIDAAGYRAGAAVWAVAEARRDIALKVVAAWSEAQRQQTRQRQAHVGVEEHEKLVALIGRRVEQEVSPSVDQDFARSRLLQAINDRTAGSQALNSALNQLSQLVGARVTRVDGELQDGGVPASLEAALSQGESHSPTLKRLEEELLAAGEDIKSRRSAYLPQLSVRFESYLGQRPAGLPDDHRVMLVLSAQPGAGLSAGSGVDAALARREGVRLAHDVAVRELNQQIVADWEELVAARMRVQNAQQARIMASNVFESYTRQFTTGRKSWIDVLNAIREATQTAFANVDAQVQAAIAAQRLRILTGQNDLKAMANVR